MDVLPTRVTHVNKYLGMVLASVLLMASGSALASSMTMVVDGEEAKKLYDTLNEVVDHSTRIRVAAGHGQGFTSRTLYLEGGFHCEKRQYNSGTVFSHHCRMTIEGGDAG